MQYLISTHAYLFLYDFDQHWRITARKTINNDHHYGIALISSDPLHFVAKSHKSELTEYRMTGSDVVDNQVFLHKDNDHIHQMTYANGGIYVANTFYNSVTYQTLDGSVRQEYHFYNSNTDTNHVNSVFPCGDLVLVMLHNFKQRSQVWVMEHDLRRGFTPRHVIHLADPSCHNVFVDDRHLYYCASGSRRFIVVDYRKHRIVKDILASGHTKGLSVTDNHLVIGVSEHAEREARRASRGQLLVLDRRKFGIVAMIDLNEEGNVGNVNEIRSITLPELARSGERSIAQNLRSFTLARGGGVGERLIGAAGTIRSRLAASRASLQGQTTS